MIPSTRLNSPSALAALLCLPVAGCSIRTGEAMYQSQCTSFSLADSTPKPNATGVLLGTAITLQMSDYPDPASVLVGNVDLLAGTSPVDLASITVDLVSKSIVVLPRSPLATNTGYALRLGTSVSSLSRCFLPAPTLLAFTTGATPGGGPPAPPQVTLAKNIQPLFDHYDRGDGTFGRCSGTGCHTGSAPAGGLVLDDGASAANLAHASSETPSLARVKPGDPAASYLLRKLVGTPDVSGSQMPLDSTFTPAQLRNVSDWIAGGAN